MEFCLSCGGIIPDGAVFCPNCGAAGTKYRLEHINEGEAAPVVTVDAEAEQSAAEAGESAVMDAPTEEAELSAAEQSARRRNERILNEAGEERAAQQSARGAEPTRDSNTMAITGFVFSLLPIPFFISPIIGLILSAAAHRRAKSGDYRNDMISLAVAGKVISIVRIVLNALIIAAVIAFVCFVAYMHNNGLELNINNLFS